MHATVAASSPSASPRLSLGRTAGLLYVGIVVLGVVSEGVVRGPMFVPGDPAGTAANVLASEGQFRLSLAADATMALFDVGLGVALFLLLRHAGLGLALGATAFRLAQAAVLGMNLLHQYGVWMLLGSELDPATAQPLAQLMFEAQGHGYDLGLLFFGVSCLLTGALLWRSRAFPTPLGVGIAVSGVVYLVGSYLRFLVPEAATAFEPAYVVPLLAESAFALWLLFRGARLRA